MTSSPPTPRHQTTTHLPAHNSSRAAHKSLSSAVLLSLAAATAATLDSVLLLLAQHYALFYSNPTLSGPNCSCCAYPFCSLRLMLPVKHVLLLLHAGQATILT